MENLISNAFVPGSDRLVIALHGTGGNEHSLLDLAAVIVPDAAVLGVRGQSLDEGVPRFFRRFAEGVFDLVDLAQKTQQLQDFIGQFRRENDLEDLPVSLLGYSNGANMALSLMMTKPGLADRAILLRAMLPYEPANTLRLDSMVLLSAGINDPMVTTDQTNLLADTLRDRGAAVDLIWQPTGHNLNRAEIDQARQWHLDRS